ncbi:hypothetical protein RSAG8_10020, partial [Rhizoctonia solani AG-8 WAC10335]
MVQADLELVGQSLRDLTLGTQIPLIANHPAVNQMAQMQVMLQAMENRLAARITQSEQRTTARIDQLSTRIDQTNVRIDQLAQTLVANDAKALARALNSSQKEGTSLLHPLPLPNGNPIPEGQFPATYGAFRRLEGAPLLELLQLYQLAVPPGALLDDRRRILAMTPRVASTISTCSASRRITRRQAANSSHALWYCMVVMSSNQRVLHVSSPNREI